VNPFDIGGAFAGVPYYVTQLVPLTKTRLLPAEDYNQVAVVTDVLCIRHGGSIYIHPERFHLFEQMVRR
jgi:hypothetical protein